MDFGNYLAKLVDFTPDISVLRWGPIDQSITGGGPENCCGRQIQSIQSHRETAGHVQVLLSETPRSSLVNWIHHLITTTATQGFAISNAKLAGHGNPIFLVVSNCAKLCQLLFKANN